MKKFFNRAICSTIILFIPIAYGADVQYLKAPEPGISNNFGTAVAIDSSTVAIGVPDQGGQNDILSGAVYVYNCDVASCSEPTLIKADNFDAYDRFGHSVAAKGNILVVGAPNEDGDSTSPMDNSLDSSGAAYVFEKQLGTWVQTGYLKASNPDSLDFFGLTVATDSETVVVGAPAEDGDGASEGSNSVRNSGSIYVFGKDQGEWEQQGYLKAVNPEEYAQFGASLAVVGNNLLVGVPFKSDAAGSVSAFRQESSEWQVLSEFLPEFLDAGDQFGWAISLYGDRAIIGAIGESGNGESPGDNSVLNSGAAYIYHFNEGSWNFEDYLKPANLDEIDQFGYSVGLYEHFAIIGARLEDGDISDPASDALNDSGAAYIFTRETGDWVERAYLKATSPDPDDVFGSSVSVTRGMALVGAPWEDSNGSSPTDNSLQDSGAAYVFDEIHYDQIFQNGFESN